MSDDLRVNPVTQIDVYSLRKVLNTSQLTDYQKVKFVKRNVMGIHAVAKAKLSPEEYNILVENRPLVSFKPIKNSFTKRGDKILLADALNIPVNDVDGCIHKAVNVLKGQDSLDGFSKDAIDTMRTYVYRHGTKEQLLTFMNAELESSKNISKTLHKNLEYHNGGVADYFIRPIHRMDNSTLVSMCNIIDSNISQAQLNGQLSELEATKLSQWALQQACVLQDNNKFLNAIKHHKELTIE